MMLTLAALIPPAPMCSRCRDPAAAHGQHCGMLGRFASCLIVGRREWVADANRPRFAWLWSALRPHVAPRIDQHVIVLPEVARQHSIGGPALGDAAEIEARTLWQQDAQPTGVQFDAAP